MKMKSLHFLDFLLMKQEETSSYFLKSLYNINCKEAMRR